LLTVAGAFSSLKRLNVPPVTVCAEQQSWSPLGPQVLARPTQEGCGSHTPIAVLHLGFKPPQSPSDTHATLPSNAGYNRLVWRPDAFGSVCFLVSGFIAYRAAARHGWRPARTGPGWWQPAVNLLGCIFFGISAVAGFVVPSTGSILDLAAANWNTSAGAACFLACALATLFARPHDDEPAGAADRRHAHAGEGEVRSAA